VKKLIMPEELPIWELEKEKKCPTVHWEDLFEGAEPMNLI